MNFWTQKRIIAWLEQALVGSTIVRKNILIGWESGRNYSHDR